MASSSPSGTTRETSLPRSASSAPKTRPVAAHSIACEIPTTRGRNHVEAASATIPLRAKTKPNRADSEASRMSIGSVMVAPTPTDAPLIAAITGLRDAAIRSDTVPPPSRGAPSTSPRSSWAARRCSLPALKVSAPPPRSAPAQNARPAPVTTATRTSSSASTASNASTSSARITAVKALSRSGRFSVMVAMPSATS